MYRVNLPNFCQAILLHSTSSSVECLTEDSFELLVKTDQKYVLLCCIVVDVAPWWVIKYA